MSPGSPVELFVNSLVIIPLIWLLFTMMQEKIWQYALVISQTNKALQRTAAGISICHIYI
jgi:hypothetical protein